MKILMATDTYRPRVNGVVTSIDTFTKEYRKRGHEVVIAAPEYPPEQMDIKREEDRANEKYVVRIPSKYIFFDPEDRWAKTKTGRAKKIIREKILTEKFDVVHSHAPGPAGWAAIKWAKKIGCPVIDTYHTLFEQYAHYIKAIPGPVGKWIVRKVSKIFCDKHDMIICPSTQMKDTLRVYGVKKNIPIKVNPTGIKIDLFRERNGGEFRKKNNIPQETKLFLFMGRIGFEKNIPFLFKVLKKVVEKRRDVMLIVAGKGPAENAVRKAAKDEGVDEFVKFMGYFTPRDWVNCYAAADIFTFASVTETQGLVVTEAMAAGTPVVAVGAMGVAEVMEPQKGGVLVRENTEEFTAQVFKMLDDKEFYAKKRAEALEYAEEWSAGAMAKRQLSLYEEAIAGKKGN